MYEWLAMTTVQWCILSNTLLCVGSCGIVLLVELLPLAEPGRRWLPLPTGYPQIPNLEEVTGWWRKWQGIVHDTKCFNTLLESGLHPSTETFLKNSSSNNRITLWITLNIVASVGDEKVWKSHLCSISVMFSKRMASVSYRQYQRWWFCYFCRTI